MELLHFLFDHIFTCLFISIMTIATAAKLFKGFDPAPAFQTMRWILIVYSVYWTSILIFDLISSAFSKEDNQIFWSRISGPYWFAYWIMLVSVMIPLLLLTKKPGRNHYWIFFCSLCISSGWILTSIAMHQSHPVPTKADAVFALEGIVLGIILIIFSKRLATALPFLNKK